MPCGDKIKDFLRIVKIVFLVVCTTEKVFAEATIDLWSGQENRLPYSGIWQVATEHGRVIASGNGPVRFAVPELTDGTTLTAVLSVAVVVVFVLFYHKIFAVTFDENFAKATGTNADGYNLLIAVVIAVIIVLAMNLVGSLLISALVIFPALSAMRLFRSFKSVTIFSAVISVICAFLGILISILGGTPVGSTIVAVDVAAFGICYLVGMIKGGN